MRVGHDELVLNGSADDVPRARRFAAAALRHGPGELLSGDVELIVSELVTNALLHAGPPGLAAGLPPRECRRGRRRRRTGRGARPAAVGADPSHGEHGGHDRPRHPRWSRRWPAAGASSPAARASWSGARSRRTRVLAESELDDPDFDLDALLAGWEDEPADEHRVTVRLGDVPTDLLLAAKSHVDNLVREFTLAAAGAESGHSAAVPLPLARLVETVVHRFAEPQAGHQASGGQGGSGRTGPYRPRAHPDPGQCRGRRGLPAGPGRGRCLCTGGAAAHPGDSAAAPHLPPVVRRVADRPGDGCGTRARSP